jgi:integrase
VRRAANHGETIGRTRHLPCGFRIAELLALIIDDVFYMGQIKETVRLPKRLMKGSHPRRPKKIYPEAKVLLSAWIKEMPKVSRYRVTRRSLLFPSRERPSIGSNQVYMILRKAARRAGIPVDGVGTHSMRKTFANACYDYWDAKARAGERIDPMRMVQRELGHASIEDTYAYMDFKLEEKPDDFLADYGLLLSSTELSSTETG